MKKAEKGMDKKKGLTKEEIAAMKETLQERRSGIQGEEAILTKITEMPEPDKSLARKLHAIIKESAPTLAMRTWYGMPAYCKGDDVLCFFQPASKFKARYMTLGFNNEAKLDEGNMWPVSYAITKLTPADEARIKALVKKAVG